jgi:DNA-binding NarL/FixJ family response regulator
MKPRALLADDHSLFVEGLKRIIQDECEVVGVAENGRDAISLAEKLKPELIFLDVTMPLLNGIEVARQIHKQDPNAKIIFVTMQLNRAFVREAFQAGASGYVMKQASATELCTAIQDVQKGRFFVSPLVSEQLLGRALPTDQVPSQLFGSLTPRQREVLQLVAEGKSAKEIASLLFISVKTVEFHKKHLMQELNLRSTAALVRYAVENGWVAG